MKIHDITPVSVGWNDDIGRLVAEPDGAANPTCENPELLVRFQSSPNGRAKFIFINNNDEITHLEADNPWILTPTQVAGLGLRNSYQVLTRRMTKLAKVVSGVKLGVFRARKKQHREIPSREDIARYFE